MAAAPLLRTTKCHRKVCSRAVAFRHADSAAIRRFVSWKQVSWRSSNEAVLHWRKFISALSHRWATCRCARTTARFRPPTAGTAKRWATARATFITWRRQFSTMRRQWPLHFHLADTQRSSKAPTPRIYIINWFSQTVQVQTKPTETFPRCRRRQTRALVQFHSP